MSGATGTSPQAQPASWRSVDGERLIALFASLVEPLGRALPAGTEVVLHDHAMVPNSIVAIHGSVSGRKVGDRSNQALLERITAATDESYIAYHVRLPDGRSLRCSAFIIRDLAGAAVATLCINVDTSLWAAVHAIASSMMGDLGGGPSPAPHAATAGTQAEAVGDPPPATASPAGADFVSNMHELAELMITREIEAAGVPLEKMKKAEKLAVVRSLKERGVFMLKDAVHQVASALGVSRFTIYNYLNEIDADD